MHYLLNKLTKNTFLEVILAICINNMKIFITSILLTLREEIVCKIWKLLLRLTTTRKNFWKFDFVFGIYISYLNQNIIVSTPLHRECLICKEDISPINTFQFCD